MRQLFDITGYIEQNRASDGDCINRYSFYKLSSINVYAAVNNVDVNTGESSDFCGGGGAAFWDYTGSNWQESGVGGHAAPYCSELAATNISSEFLDGCVDESSVQNQLSPNPNGTLAEIISDLENSVD